MQLGLQEDYLDILQSVILALQDTLKLVKALHGLGIWPRVECELPVSNSLEIDSLGSPIVCPHSATVNSYQHPTRERSTISDLPSWVRIPPLALNSQGVDNLGSPIVGSHAISNTQLARG
ncbi:hypothetical protein PoB_005666800 [Plakobranchus ocellatus]|uniref:Uncharacterized protein n=1 Tax=Plakobranchus ocellatus TaxID=259542 RepID=A0AAV4CGM5_9GAST|nr:hypothetical protein PoB_005666800 [Plakobranchus ocellatus]